MPDRDKDLKKVDKYFNEEPEKARKYYERSQGGNDADWEEFERNKRRSDELEGEPGFKKKED